MQRQYALQTCVGAMPRSIWKGSIAFGLVSIPVELHTAVRDHRPKFRMLHARDKSPVRYERVCQREGKPVAWEDLVKGFEYEKGRFVVLTKEDLKTAALAKDRAIDILDFVKGEEIDDRYFETPVLPHAAKRIASRVRAAARRAQRLWPRRDRQDHHSRGSAPRRRRGHRERAGADDAEI